MEHKSYVAFSFNEWINTSNDKKGNYEIKFGPIRSTYITPCGTRIYRIIKEIEL